MRQTPIGEIPADWHLKPLGENANVLFSNVDKKTVGNELPVKLCNYTDVYYNDKITNEIEFMNASATKEEIKKFSLVNGDVIITKDSETPEDIAVPALVIEDFNNVLCGYHLALIRTNRKVLLGEYLAKLFYLQRMRYYFFTLSNGVTRFGLPTQSLLNATIPLPPLPEQKKSLKSSPPGTKPLSLPKN